MRTLSRAWWLWKGWWGEEGVSGGIKVSGDKIFERGAIGLRVKDKEHLGKRRKGWNGIGMKRLKW
ncbi:hypothetical protein [Bartonella tribocorum]|uniref:hypothetical protein n=1 Tax=Bartonella tribocorum TaxID=85701 RepID=UPI00031F147B|nr:hypothetical protein [Bartonella tribocorum]